MKKIIFYIDTMYRGGAQRVVANLIGYMDKKGYDIILVNDFPQDNRSQYALPKHLHRIYLRAKLGGNPLFKNIARTRNLRNVIKKEKPDVVISFLGRPNIRMLLATIGLHVRKIVSVRNDPEQEYGSSKLRRWLIGKLFQLTDGCVFQTEQAMEYFPVSVRERSAVILNPVNDEFYSIERSTAPENIVAVGRLEPQKNFSLLLDAFSGISKDFPEEKLLICGEGPLHSELEEHAQELGLSSRVDFLGNVSDIKPVLAKAEVFVLSSDYEGLPNALMEAMAAGVPCVSTDCPCGGPRSLIQTEDEGILVPVGDLKQMIYALRMLLGNPARQEVLSVNARKRAEVFRTDKVFSAWETYIIQ